MLMKTFLYSKHMTGILWNVLLHYLPDPELGCPTKLVSIRNNRKWNRNLFRHYPKQDVCFGCFDSISKQHVSVFRLNRNKEKGTETNRKRNKFGK
jgi:hypothetical protein